jgi:predicted transcriptional regulator
MGKRFEEIEGDPGSVTIKPVEIMPERVAALAIELAEAENHAELLTVEYKAAKKECADLIKKIKEELTSAARGLDDNDLVADARKQVQMELFGGQS